MFQLELRGRSVIHSNEPRVDYGDHLGLCVDAGLLHQQHANAIDFRARDVNEEHVGEVWSNGKYSAREQQLAE